MKPSQSLLSCTVENQKAIGGVLITLDKPTKPMRDEAASAGRYESRLWQEDYAPPQVNPFAMAAREATEHKQTEVL